MKKTYLDELYTAKDKANKALDALDSWRLKDIAHEDKYTNEAKRKVIQMHINALENLIQIYIDTHKSGITDRTDEPKVDTSRFRVVDGELLALKEPPTFEQWRDKHFKLSLFHNPDSPKDVHWISRKTPQAVFSEDVLKEYYEFWKMCL